MDFQLHRIIVEIVDITDIRICTPEMRRTSLSIRNLKETQTKPLDQHTAD